MLAIVLALLHSCASEPRGAAALESRDVAHLFTTAPGRVEWFRTEAPFTTQERVAVFPQLDNHPIETAEMSVDGRLAVVTSREEVLALSSSGGLLTIATSNALDHKVAFGSSLGSGHVLRRASGQLRLLRESEGWAEIAAVETTSLDRLALAVEADGTPVGFLGTRPVTLGSAATLVIGSALLPSYAQSVSATTGTAGRAVLFAEAGGPLDIEIHRLSREADGTWIDEVVESVPGGGTASLLAASGDGVVAMGSNCSLRLLLFDSAWVAHSIDPLGFGCWSFFSARGSDPRILQSDDEHVSVYEREGDSFAGRRLGRLSAQTSCSPFGIACVCAEAPPRPLAWSDVVSAVLAATIVAARRRGGP